MKIKDLPILCISLADSDRREAMKNQADNLDFKKFRFIDAEDGRDKKPAHYILNNSYDPVETNRLEGRKLTAPEIAISLSHVNCYSTIVNENFDYALIIEDDAIAIDEHLHIFEDFKIPQDGFEILFLESTTRSGLISTLFKNRVIYKTLHKVSDLLRKSPVSSLWEKNTRKMRNVKPSANSDKKWLYPTDSYEGSTCAYIISRAGAEKLLKSNMPIVRPADSSLLSCLRNKTLEGYLMFPKIFINASVNSDAESQNF